MMFGGIANSDHDDCIRIIHKAWISASTSSTPPIGTATASRRRLSESVEGRRQNVVLATR